jgi:hypothetical protein
MRPDWIVLPELVWAKVEGFGEGRAGGTVEPKPEGFGPNQPGPLGFRAADARYVEPLGRWPASTFASLLPDRLAARETELIKSGRMLL